MRSRTTRREASSRSPENGQGGLLAWLISVVVLACALGLLYAVWPVEEVPAGPDRPWPAAPARPLITAPAADGGGAVVEALPTVTCAMQALQLSLGTAEDLTLCVAGTEVRQNGSVRSYSVRGGEHAGWELVIDVAGGALWRVTLADRDGRRYACADEACHGVTLGRHDSRGLRQIELRSLQLRAAATAASAADPLEKGQVTLSGRLAIPPDDQVPGLACVGPSLQVAARDGSVQKFCGQGGAGVEMAEEGLRRYRFEDFEGRSLVVTVDAEQRVASVDLAGFGCRGGACTGASVSPLDPRHALGERSFYFGRTPLHAGSHVSSSAPGLSLDGTLTMPSQE